MHTAYEDIKMLRTHHRPNKVATKQQQRMQKKNKASEHQYQTSLTDIQPVNRKQPQGKAHIEKIPNLKETGNNKRLHEFPIETLKKYLSWARSADTCKDITQEDMGYIVECCDYKKPFPFADKDRLTRIAIRVLSYIAQHRWQLPREAMQALSLELNKNKPQTRNYTVLTLSYAICNGQSIKEDDKSILQNAIRELKETNRLLHIHTITVGLAALARLKYKLDRKSLRWLQNILLLDDLSTKNYFYQHLKPSVDYGTKKQRISLRLRYKELKSLKNATYEGKLLNKDDLTWSVRRWNTSHLSAKEKVSYIIQQSVINGQRQFEESERLGAVLYEGLHHNERKIKHNTIHAIQILQRSGESITWPKSVKIDEAMNKSLSEIKIFALRAFNANLMEFGELFLSEQRLKKWRRILNNKSLLHNPDDEIQRAVKFSLAFIDSKRDASELTKLMLQKELCITISGKFLERAEQRMEINENTLIALAQLLQSDYPDEARYNACLTLSIVAEYTSHFDASVISAIIKRGLTDGKSDIRHVALDTMINYIEKSEAPILRAQEIACNALFKFLKKAIKDKSTNTAAARLLTNLIKGYEKFPEIQDESDSKENPYYELLALSSKELCNPATTEQTKLYIIAFLDQAVEKGARLNKEKMEKVEKSIQQGNSEQLILKVIVLIGKCIKKGNQVILSEISINKLINYLRNENETIILDIGHVFITYIKFTHSQISSKNIDDIIKLAQDNQSAFLAIKLLRIMINKEWRFQKSQIDLILKISETLWDQSITEYRYVAAKLFQTISLKHCLSEAIIQKLVNGLEDSDERVIKIIVDIIYHYSLQKKLYEISDFHAMQLSLIAADENIEFSVREQAIKALAQFAKYGKRYNIETLNQLSKLLILNNHNNEIGLVKLLLEFFKKETNELRYSIANNNADISEIYKDIEQLLYKTEFIKDVIEMLECAQRFGYQITEKSELYLIDIILQTQDTSLHESIFKLLENHDKLLSESKRILEVETIGKQLSNSIEEREPLEQLTRLLNELNQYLRGYDLALMSDGIQINKNRLYVRMEGDGLHYTVMAPNNEVKEDVIPLKELKENLGENDHRQLTENFTLQNLQPYLSKILQITSKRGHTHLRLGLQLSEVNLNVIVRLIEIHEAKLYPCLVEKSFLIALNNLVECLYLSVLNNKKRLPQKCIDFLGNILRQYESEGYNISAIRSALTFAEIVIQGEYLEEEYFIFIESCFIQVPSQDNDSRKSLVKALAIVDSRRFQLSEDGVKALCDFVDANLCSDPKLCDLLCQMLQHLPTALKKSPSVADILSFKAAETVLLNSVSSIESQLSVLPLLAIKPRRIGEHIFNGIIHLFKCANTEQLIILLTFLETTAGFTEEVIRELEIILLNHSDKKVRHKTLALLKHQDCLKKMSENQKQTIDLESKIFNVQANSVLPQNIGSVIENLSLFTKNYNKLSIGAGELLLNIIQNAEYSAYHKQAIIILSFVKLLIPPSILQEILKALCIFIPTSPLSEEACVLCESLIKMHSIPITLPSSFIKKILSCISSGKINQSRLSLVETIIKHHNDLLDISLAKDLIKVIVEVNESDKNCQKIVMKLLQRYFSKLDAIDKAPCELIADIEKIIFPGPILSSKGIDSDGKSSFLKFVAGLWSKDNPQERKVFSKGIKRKACALFGHVFRINPSVVNDKKGFLRKLKNYLVSELKINEAIIHYISAISSDKKQINLMLTIASSKNIPTPSFFESNSPATCIRELLCDQLYQAFYHYEEKKFTDESQLFYQSLSVFETTISSKKDFHTRDQVIQTLIVKQFSEDLSLRELSDILIMISQCEIPPLVLLTKSVHVIQEIWLHVKLESKIVNYDKNSPFLDKFIDIIQRRSWDVRWLSNFFESIKLQTTMEDILNFFDTIDIADLKSEVIENHVDDYIESHTEEPIGSMQTQIESKLLSDTIKSVLIASGYTKSEDNFGMEFDDVNERFVYRIEILLSIGWSYEKITEFLYKIKSYMKINATNGEYIISLLHALDEAYFYSISENEFYEQYKNTHYADFSKHLHKLSNNKRLNLHGEKKRVEVLFAELCKSKINKNNASVFGECTSGNLQKYLCEIDAIYQNEQPRLSDFVTSNPISKWDDSTIQAWATHIATLPDKRKLYPEMLAVIKRACMLHSNCMPRDTQLLSVLLFLTKKLDSGRFAQIATGEGKSLIIAMLATIKSLEGETVDIVTSSWILAKGDAARYQSFYRKFNLKAASNEDERYLEGKKSCYSSDVNIIYGDANNFEFDILRHEYSDLKTRGKREFGYLILDEVDNSLIDESGKIAMLANMMPGMNELTLILISIWQTLLDIDTRIHTENGTLYFETDTQVLEFPECDKMTFVEERLTKAVNTLLDLKGCDLYLMSKFPKNLEEYRDSYILLNNNELYYINSDKIKEQVKIKDFNKFLTNISSIDKDNAKKIHLSYPQSYEFITLNGGHTHLNHPGHFIYPIHLKNYVETEKSHWIHSAMSAFYQYRIDCQYDIKPDHYGLPTIVPIDFENTGVLQKGTTWNNGLHQFLQLKHGLPVAPLTVTTNLLSNRALVKRYKHRVTGLTGTLGSKNAQELLSQIYGIDLVKIPTHKTKQFDELPGIIRTTNETWQQEILLNAFREANHGRVVLIICETKDEAMELHNAMHQHYAKTRLYVEDEFGQAEVFQDEIQMGTIVIATHLASRGTDLKLSKEVIENGGAHVIATALAHDLRIERQIFGRASRKGEPGTAQLILKVNPAQIPIEIIETENIDALKALRDDAEATRLNHIKHVEFPVMRVKDKLFKKFCLLLKELDSMDIDEDEKPFMRLALEERWGLWLKTIEQKLNDRGYTDVEAMNDFNIFSEQCKQAYKNKTIIHNPIYYIKLGNYWLSKIISLSGKFSAKDIKAKATLIRTPCENAIAAFDKAINLDPEYCYLAYYYKAYALIKLAKKNQDYKELAKAALNKAASIIDDHYLVNYQARLLNMRVEEEPTNRKLNRGLLDQWNSQIEVLKLLSQSIHAGIKKIETSQKLLDIYFESENQINSLSKLTTDQAFNVLETPQKASVTVRFHDLKASKDIQTQYQSINTLVKAPSHANIDIIFESQNFQNSQESLKIAMSQLLPIHRSTKLKCRDLLLMSHVEDICDNNLYLYIVENEEKTGSSKNHVDEIIQLDKASVEQNHEITYAVNAQTDKFSSDTKNSFDFSSSQKTGLFYATKMSNGTIIHEQLTEQDINVNTLTRIIEAVRGENLQSISKEDKSEILKFASNQGHNPPADSEHNEERKSVPKEKPIERLIGPQEHIEAAGKKVGKGLKQGATAVGNKLAKIQDKAREVKNKFEERVYQYPTTEEIPVQLTFAKLDLMQVENIVGQLEEDETCDLRLFSIESELVNHLLKQDEYRSAMTVSYMRVDANQRTNNSTSESIYSPDEKLPEFVGCNLYLMSSLPEKLEEFKNSYILDDDDKVLYYINSAKEVEIIKIDNFKKFLAGINAINELKNNVIHLSEQQFKELITLNGGHTHLVNVSFSSLNKSQIIELLKHQREYFKPKPGLLLQNQNNLTLIFNGISQSRTDFLLQHPAGEITLGFMRLKQDDAKRILRVVPTEHHDKALISISNLSQDEAKSLIKVDRKQEDFTIDLQSMDAELKKVITSKGDLLLHKMNGNLYFYELKERKPLPIRTLCTVFALGCLQIASGIAILAFTGGAGFNYALGCFTEGVCDLIRVAHGFYSRDLSFSTYIWQKSVSLAISMATAGWSSIESSSGTSVVSQVANELKDEAACLLFSSVDDITQQAVMMTTKSALQHSTQLTAKEATKQVVINTAKKLGKEAANRSIDALMCHVKHQINPMIKRKADETIRVILSEGYCSEILNQIFVVQSCVKHSTIKEEFLNRIKCCIQKLNKDKELADFHGFTTFEKSLIEIIREFEPSISKASSFEVILAQKLQHQLFDKVSKTDAAKEICEILTTKHILLNDHTINLDNLLSKNTSGIPSIYNDIDLDLNKLNLGNKYDIYKPDIIRICKEYYISARDDYSSYKRKLAEEISEFYVEQVISPFNVLCDIGNAGLKSAANFAIDSVGDSLQSNTREQQHRLPRRPRHNRANQSAKSNLNTPIRPAKADISSRKIIQHVEKSKKLARLHRSPQQNAFNLPQMRRYEQFKVTELIKNNTHQIQAILFELKDVTLCMLHELVVDRFRASMQSYAADENILLQQLDLDRRKITSALINSLQNGRVEIIKNLIALLILNIQLISLNFESADGKSIFHADIIYNYAFEFAIICFQQPEPEGRYLCLINQLNEKSMTNQSGVSDLLKEIRRQFYQLEEINNLENNMLSADKEKKANSEIDPNAIVGHISKGLESIGSMVKSASEIKIKSIDARNEAVTKILESIAALAKQTESISASQNELFKNTAEQFTAMLNTQATNVLAILSSAKADLDFYKEVAKDAMALARENPDDEYYRKQKEEALKTVKEKETEINKNIAVTRKEEREYQLKTQANFNRLAAGFKTIDATLHAQALELQNNMQHCLDKLLGVQPLKKTSAPKQIGKTAPQQSGQAKLLSNQGILKNNLTGPNLTLVKDAEKLLEKSEESDDPDIIEQSSELREIINDCRSSRNVSEEQKPRINKLMEEIEDLIKNFAPELNPN